MYIVWNCDPWWVLFCYCLTSISSEFKYRHIKNSGIIEGVGTYSIQKTCRPPAERVEIRVKPVETVYYQVYIKTENKLATLLTDRQKTESKIYITIVTFHQSLVPEGDQRTQEQRRHWRGTIKDTEVGRAGDLRPDEKHMHHKEPQQGPGSTWGWAAPSRGWKERKETWASGTSYSVVILILQNLFIFTYWKVLGHQQRPRLQDRRVPSMWDPRKRCWHLRPGAGPGSLWVWEYFLSNN